MAFPTTPILDNFNRGDEGPPPSANWTTVTWSDGGLKVLSNAAVPEATTTGDYIIYWNASTFGPNLEARFTIVDYVITANVSYAEFYLLVDDPVDFNVYYYIEIDKDGFVRLYRESGIKATETVTLTDGDQWGIEIIDGVVTI